MNTAIKSRDITESSTVYMEILGENRIRYRVICDVTKDMVSRYGIEIEQKRGFFHTLESIPDFSGNVDSAVLFAENLVAKHTLPQDLYDEALGYLKDCI